MATVSIPPRPQRYVRNDSQLANSIPGALMRVGCRERHRRVPFLHSSMMLASSPLRVEYARCNNVFRISCLPRCLWASCLCSPARHGRGDEMAGCLLFLTAENLRKFRDVTSIAILDYCESELFLIFVVTGVEKELIVLKKRIQVINIYIYIYLYVYSFRYRNWKLRFGIFCKMQ